MAQNTSPDFTMMFDNGLGVNNDLSDIKIRVGASNSSPWVFAAHQLLLRASSPVFAAMLSSEGEETKKEEIVIEDIPPNVFYSVLLYIYKGTLELQAISEAITLYLAADKYKIENLKSACAEKLQKHSINWDNFWDLLSNSFGENIAPFQLKLKLVVFLDENAVAVFTSNKFLFLSHELVTMIISRNSMRDVPEKVVCEALANWAKMQCFKTNVEPTTENQRRVLGDAFYKMKLTVMDKKELFASPVYKMLTEQEKADIWQGNANSSLLSALSRTRRGSNIIDQRSPRVKGSTKGPVYFVFAKDAYVQHLNAQFYATAVRKFVLSVLNEDGRETVIPHSRLISGALTGFYAKAFVCYKLSFVFEMNAAKTSNELHSCLLSGALGYEDGDDKAVFFSVNEELVPNYSKLVSSDNWKNAFSTQTFERDDSATCINSMQATFC